MRGPKRGSGPRSNWYSEEKLTNWRDYDAFHTEIATKFLRKKSFQPEIVIRLDSELDSGKYAGARVKIYTFNLHRAFVRPFDANDIAQTLAEIHPKYLVALGGIYLLGGTASQARAASGRQFHFGCYGWWSKIFLHPFPRSQIDMPWKKPPRPHVMWQYRRMGAEWRPRRRGGVMHFSEASIRRLYLYNVLLHEIGHHADPRCWHRDDRSAERFADSFAVHCYEGLDSKYDQTIVRREPWRIK